MKFPKCKRDIKDSSKFCGYCGNKFKTTANQAAPTPAPSVQPVQPLESNVAKCPKCGSTSLQARKKGISVGKSVAGALLVGPLGLAAGGIGMNKTEIVCLNCGNVFKAN